MVAGRLRGGAPADGSGAHLGPVGRHAEPGGIRFGSADVYGVVERWFAAEVAESLCVGQRRAGDGDESVFLFLVMREGVKLREKGLEGRIRESIARDLSKRHVPRYIFEVPDIPVS